MRPSAQEHSVDVVQGTGPRGLLVTLYFDKQTGLLLRELRYGTSPIGRVPTQIDFADYRDVNGIKLPFRITYAWLDGRDSIVLSEIKTNVPVDEAKFGKPAPLKPPVKRGQRSDVTSSLRRLPRHLQAEEQPPAVGKRHVLADGAIRPVLRLVTLDHDLRSREAVNPW